MSNSATPRAVLRQIPLSMRFSWQEYWSGFLVPPPGDLPDQEIQPTSPTTPALAGRFFITEPPHLGSSYIVGALLLLQGCRVGELPLLFSLLYLFEVSGFIKSIYSDITNFISTVLFLNQFNFSAFDTS